MGNIIETFIDFITELRWSILVNRQMWKENDYRMRFSLDMLVMCILSFIINRIFGITVLIVCALYQVAKNIY